MTGTFLSGMALRVKSWAISFGEGQLLKIEMEWSSDNVFFYKHSVTVTVLEQIKERSLQRRIKERRIHPPTMAFTSELF
jgi:hypothetical protein